MSAKKMGLGRGLNTLIPKAPIVDEEDIEQVKKKVSRSSKTKKKEETKKELTLPIDKIEPNPDQPRNQFDEDTLQELADSIKQYGMLQPILVTPKDDFYEIIAGERRWRAAKQAGLNEVPVMIRKYNENEIVEIALIENIQRDNLNPIEEAMAYKRLMEEFELKQDEVATKVSKSRASITNSLRLLKLDPRVQKMLEEEMISTGHARALLAISNKDKQYEIAQKVFDEKLSVRDIEKLVKDLKKIKKNKKEEKKSINDMIIEEAVKQFKEGKIQNSLDVESYLDGLLQPLMQKLLDAELDNHLEYSKYEHRKNEKKNFRNGYCKTKKVKTKYGNILVKTPRDRNSKFEPKIIEKGQTKLTGFEEKCIALYAKGVSFRDIEQTLKDIYGIKINKDEICRLIS